MQSECSIQGAIRNTYKILVESFKEKDCSKHMATDKRKK
jgi:hypothetical protein